MKRLTNKQLIKMIEDLAKEVADLKARPVEQHHHHYYPQPVIQPYVAPQWPEQPTAPWNQMPTIICATPADKVSTGGILGSGTYSFNVTMHNDDDNASGVLAPIH